MDYTNENIANMFKNMSKCGVEALAQGNYAFKEHMKHCRDCRFPFLINNITPNDLEAYLSFQQESVTSIKNVLEV